MVMVGEVVSIDHHSLPLRWLGPLQMACIRESREWCPRQIMFIQPQLMVSFWSRTHQLNIIFSNLILILCWI